MNVVFMIFNRPCETRRVFEQIRAARPKRLLVVADGPRAALPDDSASVAAARRVVELVDWPCEVLKNYAEANMGCRRRIASGLKWAFGEVEDAIILEDDCLPHPSFFPYCAELLERYRDDARIMHVGANNFQGGRRRGHGSYYFSKYSHIWGWATWRRAWSLYDTELEHWRLHGAEVVNRLCKDESENRFWQGMFNGVNLGRINTWDCVWLYSCWAHGGLSILPNVNLVSNIGFSGISTHTDNSRSPLAKLAAHEISFPLLHPQGNVQADGKADLYTWHHVFCANGGRWSSVSARIGKTIRRCLGGKNDASQASNGETGGSDG